MLYLGIIYIYCLLPLMRFVSELLVCISKALCNRDLVLTGKSISLVIIFFIYYFITFLAK